MLKHVFLCVFAGLTTLGLYRTGGVNSKVQRLMTSVFGKSVCVIFMFCYWFIQAQ